MLLVCSGLVVSGVASPTSSQPPNQLDSQSSPSAKGDAGVRLALDEDLFSELVSSESVAAEQGAHHKGALRGLKYINLLFDLFCSMQAPQGFFYS